MDKCRCQAGIRSDQVGDIGSGKVRDPLFVELVEVDVEIRVQD